MMTHFKMEYFFQLDELDLFSYMTKQRHPALLKNMHQIIFSDVFALIT